MTFLPRVLALCAAILLLGIAPRPYDLAREFERVRRAQTFNSPLAAARQLAALAAQLPWRGDLWEQAARAALEGGDREMAIAYFASAPALSRSGQLALGETYAQNGQLEEAIRIWQPLAEDPALAVQLLPRLADAYLEMGDYEAAVGALQALAARRPQPDSDYKLGLLLAASNPGAAPPYLLRAAETDPALAPSANALVDAIQRTLGYDSPAYTLVEVGRALASQNHWDLAGRAFYQAASLRPDYAEAWAYLGEAYQQLQPPDEAAARKALQEARRINPESPAVNIFLATYWLRQGDSARAQPYLEAATLTAKDDPALQAVIGEMWAQQGDLETAVGFYQRNVALRPYDAAAYQALAEFCIRYNYSLNEIGLAAARQAVMLAPHSPGALDTLGQILYRLGDRLNAARFFRRAIERDAAYPPALLHLGIIYLEQGDSGQALTHLRRASELAPGTPTAEHARRLLEDYLTP